MSSNLLDKLNQFKAGNENTLFSLDKHYTLAQINNLCQHLEEILQQENIELLALHAENGPHWVVADLVCQRMNICLVPLPTFFSPLQVAAVLDQSQAEYLLTDNPDLFQVLVETTDFPCDPETGLQLCKVNNIAKKSSGDVPAYPAQTGKITFTSGSTGIAKGVCLSNEQLLTQAEVLKQVVCIESPRHLCLLPLGTLLENVAGVYAPLLAGGEVFLPSLSELGYQGSRLTDPQKMLGLIQQLAPDTIILIPELLKLLVSAAKAGWPVPDSFKFIAVGGSKVGKTLLQEAWSLGIPVYEGYGLSECTSVVSLNTQSDRQEGSCGKPLPHVQVHVVDGEIVVKGNAMLGYMNDPDSWGKDAIRTGDLGYQDKNGFVHLDGRKKNILISSYGRNISPEWPESELLANPLLQDAVVFGDARPFCVALISCRDAQLDKEVVRKLIQLWIDKVNKELPDYARIRTWHQLELPLAATPGLLTRNGRPRRDEISNHFAAEIEALYQNDQLEIVNAVDEPAEKGMML